MNLEVGGTQLGLATGLGLGSWDWIPEWNTRMAGPLGCRDIVITNKRMYEQCKVHPIERGIWSTFRFLMLRDPSTG